MADEILARDQNRVTVLGAITNDADQDIVMLRVDPITKRLLVSASGSGLGTVTSVSVVTANGFAGTVANPTTTSAITLSTTVTGLLKGDGTAISAAVANTDYQVPITLTTTGTSGAATFNGTTLNIPQYQAAGTYVTSVSGTANRITSTGGTTPVIDISASYVGQTSITTLGTITTGTWSATTIAVDKGGTGVTSYTIGDILYASGATTLSKLADVATGNALISGGVGVAPSWGKIGLTTHISGTLGVGNGGTGTSTAFTPGSVVFAGASGIYTQDNANFFWDDTNNFLQVGGALTGVTSDANALYNGAKTANSFVTLNFQNKSNGAAASTDAILYNDAGTNSANYLNIGINSSGFTGASILNGPGDAYIYNVSEDIVIGTATAGKNVVIFTGGTGGTAASKTRATFTDTGLQMMDGSAAAPSISFAGSTTTGFYESSAGVLGVSIAGTSRATWSGATLSTNSSNGGTMDLGGTAQFMDFGGTQTPSGATFQTVRTSLTWTPDVNRTNAFAFNNQLVLGGSTTGISITTLVGNRSAILTGSGSTIGFTFTSAIAFEARQFVNNSSGTVTGTNEIGFLANNMTNTVSTNKQGFVGELSSGATKWNLYMSGTAQNWLEGSTGIGISVPTAKLHVVQTGTTTPVQTLSSTATNDDPTEITLQSRVATTNATVTTLGTIASATGYSYLVKTRIVARRTGGAGGAAGDYATYEITASANNEAGTLNIDAVTTTVVWEDQAGWDATIDASGTDIRIRVTGAASNNITWHATTMYYLLST